MKKVYIAADVGTNWRGDIDLGIEMIRNLKAIGVDGVKFQIWRAKSQYQPDDAIWKAFPDLEKYELRWPEAKILQEAAKAVGVDWFASAFTAEDVKKLADMQPRFLKVAASAAADFNILNACVDSGLHTIISLSAQHRRLPHGEYFSLFGHRDDYRLVYCISKYPTPVEDVRVDAMDRYDGFSDHTLSEAAPIAAAASGLHTHGSFYVECHVMPDGFSRTETPDACCSKTVSQMARIVAGIRDVERMY